MRAHSQAQEPVVLFVYDAHKVPIKTLLSLKRLMQIVRQRSKRTLSVCSPGIRSSRTIWAAR